MILTTISLPLLFSWIVPNINCFSPCNSFSLNRHSHKASTTTTHHNEYHQYQRQHNLQAHDNNNNNNNNNNKQSCGGQITFQYSPSSLKHLEATELPDDYSRPWTKEKFQALGGAFLLGGLCATLGEYVALPQLGDEDAKLVSLILGSLGTAAGYYLSGGEGVMQAERSINGGYDRKLVMDKPARLQTVLRDLTDDAMVGGDMDGQGCLTIVETARDGWDDLSLPLEYIRSVHGEEYLDLVRSRSEQADRPVRFNPLYARTLVDQFTYEAAVHAVADWMDSVDAALQNESPSSRSTVEGGTNTGPKFALVRPPSHHACRSKAMGGCFFNSASIAAFYALDQPNVQNVAILDIDAHHGNGIAHCVEDEPRIRYCSIHEVVKDGEYMINPKVREDDDPRSSKDCDHGPLGNICNINLKSRTGWDMGYNDALLKKALPFLMEDDPSLLIVAAGFDAISSDGTSRLTLIPEDYEKIGNELYQRFGNRVAFGLEGGYSWQEHDLSQALIAFVKPWRTGL